MARLTKEEFWESTYVAHPGVEQAAPTRSAETVLKNLLGKRLSESMRSYEDYLLWDALFERYLPKVKGAKALEVGSAPGEFLVRLGKAFGFVPYGIEYTETGAALNKEIFRLNNFDPANAIHGDFFAEEFQQRYAGYFDLVISRGFIEHFDEVEDAIDKHMNLLKPGGYLVVSVPNFRGIYHVWVKLFRKRVLAMHNLRIMQRKEFARIFHRPNRDLIPLFCDYYGTFSSDLIHADKNSPLRLVVAFIHSLQPILNIVFRSLFKDKGKESAAFSPHLLFIGVKRV